MSHEAAGKTFSKLMSAYEAGGKKAAIAAQLGISESQLSKLVHNHGPLLGRLMEMLGLDLVDAGYQAALEKVLKEKLNG